MPDRQPSAARTAAYRALMRVEGEDAYSNIALRAELRRANLNERDRAFCSALVYGTLERSVTLDAVLARFLKAPVSDREVRVILRMGAYQLLYQQIPPRAAVDESVQLCRLARKKSACGLCNAVLRAVARAGLPENLPEHTALGVTRGFYDRLVHVHGKEAASAFLKDALCPPPLFVRVHTGRIGTDELIARLAEEGVSAEKTVLPDALVLAGTGDMEGLSAFREGLFHVQDLSSQLCALALDAHADMRVLDTCAAPGGKTFTIAQTMEGRGRVVACDIHPHKIRLIEDGAKRLGLDCVSPMLNDAGKYNGDLADFDRVLCDVPCSALGGLRRRPELRVHSVPQLAEMQYKLLETSSQYLKEGGILVYSTCTVFPEENDQVVERFLKEHPDFTGASTELLGNAWKKTFLPGAEWPGDGFFVARLTRTHKEADIG